jgi:hypothetical protein
VSHKRADAIAEWILGLDTQDDAGELARLLASPR